MAGAKRVATRKINKDDPEADSASSGGEENGNTQRTISLPKAERK